MSEGDLLGVHEIAALLGISRQRVDKVSRTHLNFPKPVADLAAGRIWKEGDIVAWAAQTGRKLKQRR